MHKCLKTPGSTRISSNAKSLMESTPLNLYLIYGSTSLIFTSLPLIQTKSPIWTTIISAKKVAHALKWSRGTFQGPFPMRNICKLQKTNHRCKECLWLWVTDSQKSVTFQVWVSTFRECFKSRLKKKHSTFWPGFIETTLSSVLYYQALDNIASAK